MGTLQQETRRQGRDSGIITWEQLVPQLLCGSHQRVSSKGVNLEISGERRMERAVGGSMPLPPRQECAAGAWGDPGPRFNHSLHGTQDAATALS